MEVCATLRVLLALPPRTYERARAHGLLCVWLKDKALPLQPFLTGVLVLADPPLAQKGHRGRDRACGTRLLSDTGRVQGPAEIHRQDPVRPCACECCTCVSAPFANLAMVPVVAGRSEASHAKRLAVPTLLQKDLLKSAMATVYVQARGGKARDLQDCPASGNLHAHAHAFAAWMLPAGGASSP